VTDKFRLMLEDTATASFHEMTAPLSLCHLHMGAQWQHDWAS
jgi:hypothetical protein